jgi:hypothetical protein
MNTVNTSLDGGFFSNLFIMENIMKTKFVLILALFSISVFGQNNITNTLGTGGTYSIKDASTTFLTLQQSTGAVDVTGVVTLNSLLNIKGGTSAGQISLYEPSGSGTNKITFKSNSMATDITYTLPAQDGTAGQVLKTDGNGNLSWVDAGGNSSFYSLTKGTIYNMSTSGSFLYINSVGNGTTYSVAMAGRFIIDCPYSGSVKRITASTSTIAAGSTTIAVYVNGSSVETKTVNMSSTGTGYTFNFTSNTFNAGDRLAIFVTPSSNMTSADFGATVATLMTP